MAIRYNARSRFPRAGPGTLALVTSPARFLAPTASFRTQTGSEAIDWPISFGDRTDAAAAACCRTYRLRPLVGDITTHALRRCGRGARESYPLQLLIDCDLPPSCYPPHRRHVRLRSFGLRHHYDGCCYFTARTPAHLVSFASCFPP